MSRSAHRVLCSAALTLFLVALPVVSTGQEASIDSQGRSVTTASPTTGVPSPNVKPDAAIPEGTVTIYSNFGSGYSYNCCTGWTKTGLALSAPSPPQNVVQAMAFTPSKGTYLLTQVDLAIGWVSGANGYKLELHDDHEGVPGRKIASWKVTGLPTFASTSSTVETIKVRGLVIVEKHHQYWLVAIPTSDEWAGWNWNGASTTGNLGLSVDGGSTWTLFPSSTLGAFDVLGWKLY